MTKRVVLFLLIGVLPGFAFSQRATDLPPIKFEDYRLRNGLRVLFLHDKSAPLVAVNVWYHVGSKDEKPGKTGFAHLFEHLMFKGSKNYAGRFRTPIEGAGASRVNGITTSDTTNYFEVMPSNYLELALFLEADRMGGLLDVMTQQKLDIEKEVVKNERRENFDNRPYATWREKAYEVLYPQDHPYHWHPIGSMSDISAASLDDVKTFFRQYYVPNNAILSVAGDFDARQAKQWIDKYFGEIPRGSEIARPNPPQPKLTGQVRKTVEDAVTTPRSYVIWHGVPKYHADQAAIEILSRILNSGHSSRLFGKLVLQKQIAQSVGLFQENKELAGLIFIPILPGSAKPLDEIEKEVFAEIELIRKETPTPEQMARALNQIESEKVFELETALEAGDKLGEYALYLNKPDYFQADLDRFRKVTPADVQRVANNYLTGNRLVLTYVPRKSPANAEPSPKRITEPEKKADLQTPENEALIAAQTAKLPKPGPVPRLSLPKIEKAKLANGLEVWTVPQAELPIVHLMMVVKSGLTSEPDQKQGVYNLTAGLLRSGTRNRSAADISNQLQTLGGSISSYLGEDYTEVASQILSRNLDQVLDIYAEVIINPTFPEAELESYRRRTIGSLAQQTADSRAVANKNFMSIVYGRNPYGRPLWGTPDSVKGLSRDDVLNYHRSTFLPNNSVLIVVGDFEKKSLLAKLEKAFGGWKPGNVATPQLPKPDSITKTTVFLIDRPGSVQSTLRLGNLGASRNSADYFALQVLNSVLGWGANSRINSNLRASKGYAYEAGLDFTYYRSAGHFLGWANVETGVTKESIVEFMKEMNGLRGQIPVTNKEMDFSKQSLIRGYPANFEQVASISFQLANLAIYGLPDSYLNDYIAKLDSVTQTDLIRVANKYLEPDKMAIVVVGDRKLIEPELKKLDHPVVFLDSDGREVQ